MIYNHTFFNSEQLHLLDIFGISSTGRLISVF